MPKTKKKKIKKIKKINSFLINLIVLILTIIIFFSAFEIILRIGFYQNPMRTRHHEYLVYTSNPNSKFVTSHIELGRTVTAIINEKGYRGEVVPYENKNNKTRIFVVGDSLAECIAFEWDNCFPAIMQKKLLEDYEVIAMASSSWALDNEYKAVEKEGLKYGPDIVVVTYFLNDFWDSSRDIVFSLDKNKNLIDNTPIQFGFKKKLIYYLSENSFVVRFILDKLDKKFSLARIGSLLGISDFRPRRSEEEFISRIPKNLFYEKYDEDIENNYLKTRLIIRKYKELADKNDFQLYFAIIPLKEQVNDRKLEEALTIKNITDQEFDINLPYERLIKILKQENISYIYPLKELRMVEHISSSYFELDGHLNEQGQYLFGVTLVKELNLNENVEK